MPMPLAHGRRKLVEAVMRSSHISSKVKLLRRTGIGLLPDGIVKNVVTIGQCPIRVLEYRAWESH